MEDEKTEETQTTTKKVTKKVAPKTITKKIETKEDTNIQVTATVPDTSVPEVSEDTVDTSTMTITEMQQLVKNTESVSGVPRTRTPSKR